MKNKLLQIQENIKSQIEKIDGYVKNYTELTPTYSIPNISYTRQEMLKGPTKKIRL